MSKINNEKVSVELDLKAQKAQEEIRKLTKETAALRKQNTEHRKEISRLMTTEGDHSAEIKRLNQAIRENGEVIDQNNKKIAKYEAEIDVTRKTAAQLGKELKRLKKELSDTSKATNPEKYRNLEKQIGETEKALAKAQRSTRGLLTSFLSLDKMGTAVKGFFLAIGMVVMNYVVGAFQKLRVTIEDFEKANSKLAAILGTDIEGVKKLTEQARFLGRTTSATASDVTGLQVELAKLGFSQDVIEKLTPSVLKFAKAVDTDLSRASAFAGAAMRIFNKDASEGEAVLASFAVATTKSALDFSKLEASLSTVGPVANSFGFSLEETTALLGQLSNVGFDANSAATATRNIFLKLCDANGDLARALGGPVTNLDELVAGMKKLNAEGIDLAKALELTDKRSVAAFSAFLEGTDSILALRDSITDCKGDFNAMSETMIDNAAGSWAGFQSAVEGLVLKFFDFREALKTIYEWGTEVVNWIGSFVDAFSPLGTMISWVAVVVGKLITTIASLVGWFTNLITQTRVGRVVLNTVVTALVTYKLAVILATNATTSFFKNIVNSAKALALKAKALATDTWASVKAAIATRSLNAALMANPFMLVVGLIATVVAGILSYNSKVDDATKKTTAWAEASQEASKQYGEQKGKIEALVMVAENENLSLDRRQRAIKELNRIIPGYNAKIDETTGKYIASKEAIDEYLKSLEKEMRYKANESKLQELVSNAESARDAYDEAEILAASKGRTYKSWLGFTYPTDEQLDRNKKKKAWEDAEKKKSDFEARMKKAIDDGTIAPPVAADGIEQVNTELTNANKTASNTVARLKEINDELKRLRKSVPQSNEELRQIQQRIDLLKEEKKALLGKSKHKRTPGTYGEDSIDEATAEADEKHQQRLLDINKQKGNISQYDYIIKKNIETIRYSDDLVDALEKLREKTDKTHTQTLDKITAEENKIAQNIVAAQQAIDKAMTESEAKAHNDRLAAAEAFYNTQEQIIKEHLNDQEYSEGQAEVYLLKRKKELHESQLTELQSYYKQVEAADYIGIEQKRQMLEKINADIRSMQSQVLTDTGNWSKLLRELMTDTTSLNGITDAYNLQKTDIIATYDAMIKAVGEGTEEAVALETEKNRRIAALNYQYQEQMWQLQEHTGLTWAQEYERELAQLENYHRQGLVKEKDYQRKKLELGVNNAKKYFDYYAGLSSSMFTEIQNAEIAKSDAKYDVLIQQAKNNGEETADLEQEKENKKLEIQKKYADVNFAIKISQIIADTAVSIMKAFADLGPIGGAIAAAMLTATGIAQVISAKAERDKIKNMQPGNVGGSSSASQATAERVLSGYSDGGYTGDGDRFEVAGVVHRGEYVVPKPIMNNPRVVDAVGTIEAIRRGRILGVASSGGGSMQGFADGGFTSSGVTVDYSKMIALMEDLRTEIKKGFRGYVLLRDIENAEEGLARARSPFTRNKKKIRRK